MLLLTLPCYVSNSLYFRFKYIQILALFPLNYLNLFNKKKCEEAVDIGRVEKLFN